MKIPQTSPTLCKICNALSVSFGRTKVLRRYDVEYYRCTACGFIQTETPYWLDEAYSSAIATLDVGIMRRNLGCSEITAAVLNLLFPESKACIDFGGGHGVLVRLMRDKGYNFFWSDLHATNDYARGFESEDGVTYNFLTAFEVLEHFTDPMEHLAKLMSLSENVFVSTHLLPDPAPALSDWWYYAPLTGQHISFYTKASLELLAKRFNRVLLSSNPYHLFSSKPSSAFLYKMATRFRIAKTLNRFYARPSLIEQDCRLLQDRLLKDTLPATDPPMGSLE